MARQAQRRLSSGAAGVAWQIDKFTDWGLIGFDRLTGRSENFNHAKGIYIVVSNHAVERLTQSAVS
jgi:hypothetical protein